MFVYLISLVLFALIALIGLLIVRRGGSSIERIVTRIAVAGFLVQILINWLFLGSGAVHNPLADGAVVEQTAISFLILCLLSIFCYSALLMIFYKAHEFYNE